MLICQRIYTVCSVRSVSEKQQSGYRVAGSITRQARADHRPRPQAKRGQAAAISPTHRTSATRCNYTASPQDQGHTAPGLLTVYAPSRGTPAVSKGAHHVVSAALATVVSAEAGTVAAADWPAEPDHQAEVRPIHRAGRARNRGHPGRRVLAGRLREPPPQAAPSPGAAGEFGTGAGFDSLPAHQRPHWGRARKPHHIRGTSS